MSRILVIGVVAACSHQEPQAATPANQAQAQPPAPEAIASREPDPAPCEAVAKAILNTRSDSIDANGAKAVIMRHCTSDLWSPAARRCVMLQQPGGTCDDKFTETQRREYDTDMKAHGITVLHSPPSL